MGAKTAVLAYADDAIANLLQDAPMGEIDGAVALVTRVRPGHRIDADNEEAWELADALYPPEGTVCALSAPGLDLVCDQEVMLDRPSELPQHLVAASQGRRLCSRSSRPSNLARSAGLVPEDQQTPPTSPNQVQYRLEMIVDARGRAANATMRSARCRS